MVATTTLVAFPLQKSKSDRSHVKEVLHCHASEQGLSETPLAASVGRLSNKCFYPLAYRFGPQLFVSQSERKAFSVNFPFEFMAFEGSKDGY